MAKIPSGYTLVEFGRFDRHDPFVPGVSRTQPDMKDIGHYVARVAEQFKSQLGTCVFDVYKLGSLAHGGFSQTYSDLDIGVILNSLEPPDEMDRLISSAKGSDSVYGKRLSVFWGNPECNWGRLPVLDRLDLLDHGVPLLNNRRASFQRPSKDDIHRALLESVEKSWKPRIASLGELSNLEPNDRKPYVRCLLYPARLIYTWERLEIHSNDRAVEYLREINPPGLDLRPIERALDCRYDRCTAEQLFALRTDLAGQFEKTISYISQT